jgi:hypothetical protein
MEPLHSGSEVLATETEVNRYPQSHSDVARAKNVFRIDVFMQ